MTASGRPCPKPPARVKSKRKGIRRIGQVTIRYEIGTRQPFLAALFLTGEPTTDPTRRTVLSGATLTSRCLPKYAGSGTVTIIMGGPEMIPPAFRKHVVAGRWWIIEGGHAHHEVGGRTQGRREDETNLVALSYAAHRKEHQT